MTTLETLFKGIADAIRNKKGTTGTIKATNFASEISSITLATGDANPADVLLNKTFSKTGANGLKGTMPNNGAWGSTINAGGSAAIPAGYHNGSGKVAANANTGNATAAQVQAGKTFYSNSATKQTGTLPYRGTVQEVTTYGSGDWTTSNPYFAINQIPEGIYASEGNSWAPEVRIRTKYLGTATNAQVLEGYTYTSKDAVVGWGAMPNRGQAQYGQNIVISGDYCAINQLPEGYYCSNGATDWAPEARINKYALGTVGAGYVLEGQTFSSSSGIKQTGYMPNHGYLDVTLNPGDEYTYGWGFYDNGSGAGMHVKVNKNMTCNWVRIEKQDGAPAQAEYIVESNVYAVCGYGLAWGDSGPQFYIDVKYYAGDSWQRMYTATNYFHRTGNNNPSTFWGCWCNPDSTTKWLYAVRVTMSDGDANSCVSGFIIKD